LCRITRGAVFACSFKAPEHVQQCRRLQGWRRDWRPRPCRPQPHARTDCGYEIPCSLNPRPIQFTGHPHGPSMANARSKNILQEEKDSLGQVTALLGPGLRAAYDLYHRRRGESPNSISNAGHLTWGGAYAHLPFCSSRYRSRRIFAQLLARLVLEAESAISCRGFIVTSFARSSLFDRRHSDLDQKGGFRCWSILLRGIIPADECGLCGSRFTLRRPASTSITTCRPGIAAHRQFRRFRRAPRRTRCSHPPRGFSRAAWDSAGGDHPRHEKHDGRFGLAPSNRACGGNHRLLEKRRRGRRICGGYQMLGQTIHDPSMLNRKMTPWKVWDCCPLSPRLPQRRQPTRRGHEFWIWITYWRDGRRYEIHMGETESQTPGWKSFPEMAGRSGFRMEAFRQMEKPGLLPAWIVRQ